MTAHNVIPFTRPPHIADARAELVKHARAILRRPDRHSHEDVLMACYYAKQFGDEDDKALAKRARQDAAETPADVARRFAHRWPEILSWGAFVAVGDALGYPVAGMSRRAPRFILECLKTGSAWTYASYAQCYRAAQRLGLKDYTIERDA